MTLDGSEDSMSRKEKYAKVPLALKLLLEMVIWLPVGLSKTSTFSDMCNNNCKRIQLRQDS